MQSSIIHVRRHQHMQLVARRTCLSVLLKAMYGGGVFLSSSDLLLPIVFFLLVRRLERLRLSAVEVERGAFKLRRSLREEDVFDR